MGNSEKHETGHRLKQIAQQMYDGNQSDLARALGMKPPSFSKYVQGNRRPGTDVLIRLCRLGVNLHWFLTGEGPIARASSGFAQPLPLVSEKKPAQIDSPDGTLYRVPLVRVTADGNGTPQLEEVSTVDWMDEASIQRRYGAPPDQLKGFRISGDAMTETLSPGSRVIGALWRGESLVDGAVYLFYCTSGVLVRRVRLKEDTVMLTAEQSGAPDLSFDVGVWSDQLRPIAHLLEAIRSL